LPWISCGMLWQDRASNCRSRRCKGRQHLQFLGFNRSMQQIG
jgi:hypothetical protein